MPSPFCMLALGKQEEGAYIDYMDDLRLQDSVLPMHVNYCARPYNTIHFYACDQAHEINNWVRDNPK